MTDEFLELPPVTAWSFSTLKQFERCAYSVYLKKIKREPGPPRDDKHPAERGVRIHSDAEHYVRGELDELPQPLRKFEEDFVNLRAMYEEGIVTLEEDWGFDLLWNQVPWTAEDIWCRMKLDAHIRHDDLTHTVIDYKTGKSFGNEVPHTAQGQTYAVGTFRRFPQIETCAVSFWYLDEGKRTTKFYDRHKVAQLEPRLTDRALKLTTCTSFVPKPSKYACQYCDYGHNKGTGACGYAAA